MKWEPAGDRKKKVVNAIELFLCSFIFHFLIEVQEYFFVIEIENYLVEVSQKKS